MIVIGKEASNFVRACEVINGLLANRQLMSDDRELVEFSCNQLLEKLTPA